MRDCTIDLEEKANYLIPSETKRDCLKAKVHILGISPNENFLFTFIEGEGVIVLGAEEFKKT